MWADYLALDEVQFFLEHAPVLLLVFVALCAIGIMASRWQR